MTNTAERIEELVAEIDEALKSNLPRRNGEKLRGRLQFASSQVFWKTLQKTVEGPVKPRHGRKTDCLVEPARA